MSIAKYVTSLLPSFERSRIEEDLRVLKEDLTQNTIPPFESAADFFKRVGFKSKDVVNFNRIFGQKVSLDRSLKGDFVSVIWRSLQRCSDSVSMVEDNVDKYFGKDVTAGGMTYSRVNVLRFIEVSGFTAKYARKLLLWTYHTEKEASGVTVGDPFTKAEMNWLTSNRESFFAALRIVSHTPKELEVLLKNIPDMIVVPEDVEVAKQTVGMARIDPLQMGIIPVVLNPVYHIGINIAEWQVSRFKAAQEEKKALEFRLLVLKDLQDGKRDARLQQQIEYTEDRVKKLNHKLAKMEE